MDQIREDKVGDRNPDLLVRGFEKTVVEWMEKLGTGRNLVMTFEPCLTTVSSLAVKSGAEKPWQGKCTTSIISQSVLVRSLDVKYNW